jgi:hypothetical protein
MDPLLRAAPAGCTIFVTSGVARQVLPYHQLLSGCREVVLRKVNGAWKVANRTIVLDANALLDKNLSVFSRLIIQPLRPAVRPLLLLHLVTTLIPV